MLCLSNKGHWAPLWQLELQDEKILEKKHSILGTDTTVSIFCFLGVCSLYTAALKTQGQALTKVFRSY